jgi:hypothetical protein
MTIRVFFYNGSAEEYGNVIDYDFYPETKILFVNREDNQSVYIPFTEKVTSVYIYGGTERGYLEGHDEAC